MKKINKFILFIILFFFSAITLISNVKAWYVSIIIVYYQYEDGSTAHDTYRENDPVYGVLYHIDSPTIEGYTPDQEYVEYVFNGTKAFIVKYYQNGYRLKINYLDQDGNTLFDSYNQVLNKNSEYRIESPIYEGYEPNISVVEGILENDTEINVIYSKNTYNLVINYIDDEGNKLADSYNQNLIKNSKYEIESPTIKGYTPNINVVEGILDIDKNIDVIYTKNDYEIKVNYLDEKNNIISDTDTFKFKYKDEYNINPKEIEGYSTLDDNVGGIIESNLEIDFIYIPNKYKLIINYIDEANNQIYPSLELELDYNSNYDIIAPIVYGYSPYLDNVSGLIKEDTIINLMYSKNDYELIINYLDEDNNILSNRYYAKLKYESEFNVPSPIIDGYTPNNDYISGKLDKNLEYDVIYTKNDYELVINYIDERGNKLIESYNSTLKYNDEYNIEVPKLEGYTPNIDYVSGIISHDTIVDVLYRINDYNLIINCFDINQNKLLKTYNYLLKYNEKYEIITPAIDNYYTNEGLVKGCMINGNVIVNIYYHRIETPIDGNKVLIQISAKVSSSIILLYFSFEIIRKYFTK